MIKDLFLSLTLPGWISFLLMWILFAVAFFYYRKTLPPLSRWRRILLLTLRSIILILALFLLLQPVLTFIYEHQQEATVAVLIDNSSSMKIEDHAGQRSDSLLAALQQIDYRELPDSIRFDFYRFSENVNQLGADTLDFSGQQTNIYQALEKVTDSTRQKNLRSILLVSDGQFNQGLNPLRFSQTSPVPIYTVPVGDSIPEKDVDITAVQVNPVVYAGEKTPVTVQLMQNGFSGGEVLVRLRQGGKQVAAKRITLPQSGFEQEVKFKIQAEKPGEFRYIAEVESPKGENNRQNNRHSFLLKVLKSKIRVLLFSGLPSFDQRLLIFNLKSLADVELTVRTEQNSGRYYEGSLQSISPDSMDVFILLGFPTSRTSQNDLQRVFGALQKNKIPLYLFLNRTVALRKLEPVGKYLAIEPSSPLRAEENVLVRLTAAGKLHPVTRLDENESRLLNLWSDLPPLTALGEQLKLTEGSSTLIASQSDPAGESFPVLVAGIRQDVKTLIFAGENFGSWHFQLQDNPQKDLLFRNFLELSLKWLVNREDIQRIQIKPERKVYSVGETVSFSGQVLDAFYREVQDAEVRIEITGEESRQEDVVQQQGGYYRYQTSGLAPGTYSYRISARRGEQDLGIRTGKFAVEEIELEMQETTANVSLLNEMSRRSGGKVWSVSELPKKIRSFDFRKNIRYSNVEHVLWDKIYWLFVLIGLLGLEWFFRKRWGLL